MKAIINISKYKTFILVLGMLAGIGIVAQPILKEYVDCETICKVKTESKKKDSASSDDDSSDERVQVSALEAVAPSAPIHVAPADFILNTETAIAKPAHSQFAVFVVKLPEKLLKVLFNILIAPNAP